MNDEQRGPSPDRSSYNEILILLQTMHGENRERLGRIEERQKSDREAADHRHANTKMILETFVPRRELEAKFDSAGRERGNLSDRIEKLETNQGWLVKTLLGAWAAGGGVAYLVFRGKGLVP